MIWLYHRQIDQLAKCYNLKKLQTVYSSIIEYVVTAPIFSSIYYAYAMHVVINYNLCINLPPIIVSDEVPLFSLVKHSISDVTCALNILSPNIYISITCNINIAFQALAATAHFPPTNSLIKARLGLSFIILELTTGLRDQVPHKLWHPLYRMIIYFHSLR